MKTFEALTRYAKEKVETTETPMNLFSKAQRRKITIDSIVTVILAAILISLSTVRLQTNTSIQSPSVREFLRQDLVATGERR